MLTARVVSFYSFPLPLCEVWLPAFRCTLVPTSHSISSRAFYCRWYCHHTPYCPPGPCPAIITFRKGSRKGGETDFYCRRNEPPVRRYRGRSATDPRHRHATILCPDFRLYGYTYRSVEPREHTGHMYTEIPAAAALKTLCPRCSISPTSCVPSCTPVHFMPRFSPEIVSPVT